MGLGINKDLEPLVREVKRRGGSVEITGSTHVRWRLPDGSITYTGLTMSDSAAGQHRRRIQTALRALGHVPVAYEVRPTDRGKFCVVATSTSEPVTNREGYPRTFAREEKARRLANQLNREVAEGARQAR